MEAAMYLVYECKEGDELDLQIMCGNLYLCLAMFEGSKIVGVSDVSNTIMLKETDGKLYILKESN